MKVTKHTFEEVSIKGTKRWKDESGKWRQKTRKFYQTMSPFNTIKGRQKTYGEIMKEILDEMNKWLSEV